VVRILLENRVRLRLHEFFATVIVKFIEKANITLAAAQKVDWAAHEYGFVDYVEEAGGKAAYAEDAWGLSKDLLSFFADRLKQHMRDQGVRHDLIDAVFALGEDDLVAITKRVEALSGFLESENGTNLLAGYKRATNILKAEEKKDGKSYQGLVNEALLAEKEEKDLFAALKEGESKTAAALQTEDFEGAMAAMSNLRGPIDAFFDRVTVNADDDAVRQNRLYLLSSIKDVLDRVADFSKIEG